MYQYNNSVAGLQPSAIREILKYASIPGVISLAAGNPAPEAFPVQKVQKISAKLMQENPLLALQYGVTEGDARLRNYLKEKLQEHGTFNPDCDEVIITSGAQQVNELACKVLTNTGDTLLCEAPSFIGSLNAFRSYGVNLHGVTLEEDGMNMEEFEEAVKTQPNVRLVYVIPNFQNPTGRVMSLEKRKKLYELAVKYDFVILEDNPYGDLRFDGEDVPSIKSMDTDGRVIYARSFSKILAPGLRVGYVSAPKPIADKMTVCKQVSDVHTNAWAQAVCYEFLTSTDMDAYLKSLQDIYRHKCKLMTDGIEKHFPKAVKWERPQGGLFLWCTLPDGCDVAGFCKTAVETYKVAIVPGSAFLIDETQSCNAIRLNFSTPPDEQIVKGIEILGKLMQEMFN